MDEKRWVSVLAPAFSGFDNLRMILRNRIKSKIHHTPTDSTEQLKIRMWVEVNGVGLYTLNNVSHKYEISTCIKHQNGGHNEKLLQYTKISKFYCFLTWKIIRDSTKS